MKKALIGIVPVVVLAVIYGFMSVHYKNTEVGLRNQGKAQQKSNEAVYDNTWKILQQIAGVADEYKNGFKEIYPALMEGRYGNARGGALLSFVTESNPQFDMKLYEKLANSIEAQRTVFTREQQKLIDIKREHDDLLAMFPSSWFVGDRDPLEIQIVTSSKTEKVFETGKEDDVDLFKKKN